MGSPAAQPYPMRDSNSQSPPLAGQEGGIRLPNAPLNDIVSIQPGSQLPTPRKSATAPMYYPGNQPQGDFYRRGSLPTPHDMQRRPVDVTLPEVTGWQPVPTVDLSPKGAEAHKAVC